MSNREFINSFFTRSFEAEYNERLMYRDYVLPSKEILDYLSQVIEIPLSEYIDAITTKFPVSHFSTKDIPQFSSFDDATDKICSVLAEKGDEGFKYSEIGSFLRNNDKKRSLQADVKYGENHCKTAADFGLIQIRIGNICYLSCFGIVFNILTELEKKEYFSRFVLRNNFINWLINRADERKVLLDEEMSILSPSTIKRRKPNVNYYLDLLKEHNSRCINKLLSNIQ